ncbi:Receptor protein kinase CLAVATA1 [Tetrabaena socialis]|uniref:Receptor protein kinase CLAVATA1 n=1 Tax=Tetrabaena socialis TaxID=47790 RepID=A0A2J7ZVI2_9CHLO|nr:Receptor protein kinase CLAVATA1 [Tetrabaena socialis]|eukprot:PNH04287.1 Receptor protein kinase CLAVATA1 [Tetrabaena socialis]
MLPRRWRLLLLLLRLRLAATSAVDQLTAGLLISLLTDLQGPQGGLSGSYVVNVSSWSAAAAAGYPPCGNATMPPWAGLSCDAANSIVGLQLSAQGLRGSIPAALARLTGLLAMDLALNNITGTLPAVWGGSLGGLSSASSNGSASISNSTTTNSSSSSGGSSGASGGANTAASGGISGGLRQLRLLDVSGNRLRGTLPVAWSRLASLQTGAFHSNALTGTVPDAWGSLSGLAPGRLTLGANGGLCGPLAAVLTRALALAAPLEGAAVGAAGAAAAAAAAAMAAAVNGTLLLQTCPWAESARLLQLLHSALTDRRGALASWVDGTDPCSATAPWAGVVCDPAAATVAGLDLAGLGLAGTLPSELALMGGGGPGPGQGGVLRQLLLDGNDLEGARAGPGVPRSGGVREET